MPKYKFVGDTPQSLPEYGIDVVRPGDVIDVPDKLNSGNFELVLEKKAPASKEGK